MSKTSAAIAAELAQTPIAIETATNSLFERSRLTNETPITWLERLCDEHNAHVRERF
jgi:hypothetical protein